MSTTVKDKPRNKSEWRQWAIRKSDFSIIEAAADEYSQKLADFGGVLVRGWQLLTPEQKAEALRRRAS